MTQASDTNRVLRIRPFIQRRKQASPLAQFAQRTPRLGRRYGRWAGLALLAALIDGKLLLAGMAGLGTYQLASQDHEQLWQQLQVMGNELKVQLSQNKTRAGLISGAAFIGSYGAIAASAQLGSAATLALLALGSVNLATLVLLVHHFGNGDKAKQSFQNGELSPRANSAEVGSEADHLDTYWRHLTASDPLKRFMAVRQLTDWGVTLESVPAELSPGGQGEKGDRDYLMDCFHLMLSQEQEPTIRTALREALQQLSPLPQ
ncbi:MAG: hypothetical protein ACFB0C_24420 [Leptolyngbyaceae cyanobacterium]